MKKYCKCGCGDTVKNEWSKGHYSRVHNDVNFNDVDFANGTDPVDIELTLRYDYAILQF